MSEPTYFPRLDGLRAVAIGCVMVEHFVPVPAIHRLGLGFVGVDLFFVLSGFLITRILIGLRESHQSVASAAKYFFWRRFLRLVPAFYAAIAIVALLGLGEMQERWWIHALYLSNFEVALQGRWNDASHFWTLSVEEQFYLLWFVLIMVLPRRLLLPVSMAFLALANLYRLTVFVTGGSFYLVILLPGVCDGLAIGSIVAIILQDGRYSYLRNVLQHRLTLFTCVGGLLAMLIVPFTSVPEFQPVLWMWMSVFAAIIVLEAVSPKLGLHLDWLKVPPLRHIGKISYGIYIWHYFVGQAISKMNAIPYFAHSFGWQMVIMLASFAVSMLVAQISWLAIEQPALRLKKRVELFRGSTAKHERRSGGISLSRSLRSSGA